MTLLPQSRLYIDGVSRDASSGKTYEVLEPWTDSSFPTRCNLQMHIHR